MPVGATREAADDEVAAAIAKYGEAVMAKYEDLSPGTATAFVEMLGRRRKDTAWAAVRATLQQMAVDSSARSILSRQAQTMDAIKVSFEPVTLLPDFSGNDFSLLESAILSLIPATTEEISDVERIATDATADPESQKFIVRIADHMPDRSEIGKMATWTGFLAVAAYMLQIAPDMDANRIAMLAVIVAVWTVLVQRSRP
jgi:hypothetical protein